MVIFTIEGDENRVAVETSEILPFINKEVSILNKRNNLKLKQQSQEIKPLNNNHNGTHYIYFKSEGKINCLNVSKIEFIHNFNKADIVNLILDEYDDGIIGLIIYKNEDVILFVHLESYLKNQMKSKYYINSI